MDVTGNMAGEEDGSNEVILFRKIERRKSKEKRMKITETWDQPAFERSPGGSWKTERKREERKREEQRNLTK